MKLRVDIRPYFSKIANHYWDTKDPATDGTIWDWLLRDYQIIKVGTIGIKPQMWVHFPDEKMLAWFLLKWA